MFSLFSFWLSAPRSQLDFSCGGLFFNWNNLFCYKSGFLQIINYHNQDEASDIINTVKIQIQAVGSAIQTAKLYESSMINQYRLMTLLQVHFHIFLLLIWPRGWAFCNPPKSERRNLTN